MERYIKIFICLLFLFITSCNNDSVNKKDFKTLQNEVTALGDAITGLAGIKVSQNNPMILAREAGARKFWWRNALVTGDDALAAISHTSLTDGDGAIVFTLSSETATGYMYIYDDDGTNTTSSPERIAPTSGGGAWHLINFYAQAVDSGSADGESYVNVSNSTDFTGTPNDGDCYYKRDDNDWCCYNGSSWNCISLD